MLNCEKCGVTVRTKATACPLCHAPLAGDMAGTEWTYPAVNLKKSRRLLMESLISLTILFVQVLVNLLTTPYILWCIPSCAAVLYSWLIVILARTGRMRKGVAWYYHLLPVAALLILFNLYVIGAGNGLSWFLTYGYAFGIALPMLINNGWILLSRRSVYNILPSQLFTCILGLVPISLALFSVIAVTWASIGAASLSFATVAAVVLIYRTRIFRALRRYFFTA